MDPRLRELAPMARGSQEVGFTQPRDQSVAQLYTSTSPTLIVAEITKIMEQNWLLALQGKIVIFYECLKKPS